MLSGEGRGEGGEGGRGELLNKRVGWDFSKYLMDREEKWIGWNLNNLAKIGSV